jgi:hypothetical protein
MRKTALRQRGLTATSASDGENGLAHQAGDRLRQFDRTQRHTLGRLRRLRRVAQEAFDDAIFEGMKADHGHASTRCQSIEGPWQD